MEENWEEKDDNQVKDIAMHSQNLPDINVSNSDPFLDEKLLLELTQDMPDPTQPDPVIDKHTFLLQDPCDSSDDFVNPLPMAPPKKTLSDIPQAKSRFKSMSDSDLDALQASSKAKNTQRSTQWGVRQFIGMYSYFDIRTREGSENQRR